MTSDIIPWWPDFAVFIVCVFLVSAVVSYVATWIFGRFM